MSTPRNNSLVYFDFDSLPEGYDPKIYPFRKNQSYVYLGEIPNAPGYCTVVDTTTSEVHAKYYIIYFKEFVKGAV